MNVFKCQACISVSVTIGSLWPVGDVRYTYLLHMIPLTHDRYERWDVAGVIFFFLIQHFFNSFFPPGSRNANPSISCVGGFLGFCQPWLTAYNCNRPPSSQPRAVLYAVIISLEKIPKRVFVRGEYFMRVTWLSAFCTGIFLLAPFLSPSFIALSWKSPMSFVQSWARGCRPWLSWSVSHIGGWYGKWFMYILRMQCARPHLFFP